MADHEVDLVHTILEVGPVLMYADRLAVPDEPELFLASPNTQRLVGRRPADVGELYDRLGDLVNPKHRDRLDVALARAETRQPALIELQLRDQAGGYRWWRIATEALSDTLIVGYLWDVTESVEAAESEEVARSEAEESRDRALAAIRAKTEFLSRMSHELRTPLNSIVGFGQLLEMQELGPLEQEWVNSLVVAGQHLLQLVDEVLDVVGLESGRLEVSLEPVDVVVIIDDAIGSLRADAVDRNISVQREATADHVWAVGDHDRILQIVVNLVDNAIRYNRRGGSVSVTAETIDDRTVVVVGDTGPGVTADELLRAFQPFDRLGVERLGIGGTGMGLSLSRALAEHMNGTLDMTSVVGTGSSLRLDLPAGQPAEVRPDDDPAPLASGEASDDQMTILYIEDNVANLRLMESVMELRPAVTLVTAMRGKLGFEIARDQHPDLVLVDLHLPDIDGRQVVRQLRAEPGTADMPIAVVSADATPGRIDEVRALGADFYLTKPIDIHELIAIVDRHLERGQGGDGGSS